MHVSLLVWLVTIGGLGVILVADLVVVGRRPHVPSLRECAIWVGVYVALAAVFGVAILIGYGPRYGGEFFAGWLTEYSLSVDNLFVFVIIMARFRTPRAYQQKALMIGIVLALLMRAGFIAAGAAALDQFSWIFYIFGAFLVYTAIHLATHRELTPSEVKENVLVRSARRVLPLTSGFEQGHLTVRRDGRRWFTPMIIVVLALGTTDLVFALDSIPAIFGLTREPFLVLAANIFALMGLRQLYFLLGGLLGRLVYLSFGLAAVLAFIGVKLVFEAMHDNSLSFINDGRPVSWAPHVPIWLSLVLIISILSIATAASLVSARRAGTRLPPVTAAASIAAATDGADAVTGGATTDGAAADSAVNGGGATGGGVTDPANPAGGAPGTGAGGGPAAVDGEQPDGGDSPVGGPAPGGGLAEEPDPADEP